MVTYKLRAFSGYSMPLTPQFFVFGTQNCTYSLSQENRREIIHKSSCCSLTFWMAFHSLQGQVLNSLCLGDSVFIKPVPCCCNFRSCHAPIPATRDISSPPGSQTGLLPLPGPSLRKSMCLGWTGRGREKIPGKTKPSRAALSLHTFQGCLACGSLQLHL